MIFQSTRPSRASTCPGRHTDSKTGDFNPQGPRGPRRINEVGELTAFTFQSTRPSRASTRDCMAGRRAMGISIHKALAGLDACAALGALPPRISIHKALAGLDFFHASPFVNINYFNPQGPRGPRRGELKCLFQFLRFQSTRPSRASTLDGLTGQLASSDFNPQGPRGPRRTGRAPWYSATAISIHKALAGLDRPVGGNQQMDEISIHKALAGLDYCGLRPPWFIIKISIHKALAGLDSKTIQQSLHIP